MEMKQPTNLELERIMKMDWTKGLLLPNADVRETVKTLGQLEKIFLDEDARSTMNQDTVVYRVQAWCPVAEGTEGAQFWGTTVIEPGQVGSEYFMTHGHFHLKRDRTEYYGTVEGQGALILMRENRETRMETMLPGTLHFIPPRTAHRVANTGKVPLRIVACWPSDAGHDYDVIRRSGFSARLLDVDGKPSLVGSEN
jgi:glucose-6-phosphate isomerase, archaeal